MLDDEVIQGMVVRRFRRFPQIGFRSPTLGPDYSPADVQLRFLRTVAQISEAGPTLRPLSAGCYLGLIAHDSNQGESKRP